MGSNTTPDPDERLRQVFERQRAGDADRVPTFERVLGRKPGGVQLARTPALFWRAALGAALVALAVDLGSWIARPITPQPPITETDLAMLYWRSPTAALLTPQDEHRQAPSQPAAAVGGMETRGTQ